MGGHWKHTVVGPDGTRYPNQTTFQEVVPPGRIVYKMGGNKEHGQGANFVATWTFDEAPGGTLVTISVPFPSVEERNLVVAKYGAIEGGPPTPGRLDADLLA